MIIGKRSMGQVFKILRLAQDYQSIDKCASWYVAQGIAMALLWVLGKEQTHTLLNQLDLKTKLN